MPSIKEYNVKLKSLRNTRKITKTMKMVSASKLRRAQEAQANAKLYAQNITALISRLSASVDPASHPLMLSKENAKKVLILIVTSDKGLCGAFNHNANKRVAQWIKENSPRYNTIDISCCGKRGFMFFKRLVNIKQHYENITLRPQFSDAKRIGNDLMRAFLEEGYDEVYIDYNQFLSPLSQKTIFEKILPIDPQALVKETAYLETQYVFEPPEKELLNFLIPHYLYFRIYFALLENSAGEHGARMSAMDNATKNASGLIDRYTLLRNRARQAQITTELTEIISGKEALN
jgi:F-type H+-transporting ATPase subunit gamma